MAAIAYEFHLGEDGTRRDGTRNPFITATPKTLGAAIERIGSIYQAVASGELDQEKGDRLVGYIDKLVKAIEVSELEKRLKILEDKANGK